MRRLLTILFLSITSMSFATRYYVSNSGNDGANGLTTTTAWKTIAKVNSSAFVAGDEILFQKGGVWREQLVPKSSGSAGSPIAFGAYDAGNAPIISGALVMSSFTSGGNNIWDKTGVTTQPNVVLVKRVLGRLVSGRGACSTSGDWFWTGNTLSVYSSGDPSGLVEAGQLARVMDTYTNSCNYLTFTGITFECANNPGSQMIYVRAPNLAGVKFYSCNIQYSAGHGIVVNGTTSTTDVVFDGCIVRGNWMDGIFVQTKGDVSINNCTIYTNGLMPTSEHNGIFGWLGGAKITNCDIYDNGRYGNNLSHGIYGMATEEPVTVTNCTIHDQPDGDALRFRGSATVSNCKLYNNVQAGVGLDGNDIYNVVCSFSYNLIYNNGNYGIIQGSAKGAGSVSIICDNNTFSNNGSDATIMIVPSVQNLVLRNNIFHSTATGGLTVSIADTKTTTHSNNVYFKSVAGDITYVKKDGININKSGVSGWEPSAVISDPLFVNSVSDWHLQPGSPAIGAGIPITAITKSLNGVTASNPPDIGCYQSTATSESPVYINSVIETATPELVEMAYNLSLANLVPATSAFTVKVNSVIRNINSVAIAGAKVQLALASAVVSGDNVTVSYTKPAVNPLQSLTGGMAVSKADQVVSLNLITGITPVAASKIKMTIFPNPVHGIVNISLDYASGFLDGSLSTQFFRILDLSGKLVFEKLLESGVKIVQIPINFRSGIYIAVMVSGGLTMSSQEMIVSN